MAITVVGLGCGVAHYVSSTVCVPLQKRDYNTITYFELRGFRHDYSLPMTTLPVLCPLFVTSRFTQEQKSSTLPHFIKT